MRQRCDERGGGDGTPATHLVTGARVEQKPIDVRDEATPIK